MRVPLLDLSEQYEALANPIRKRIDEVPPVSALSSA
jgi:hypothetical protein